MIKAPSINNLLLTDVATHAINRYFTSSAYSRNARRVREMKKKMYSWFRSQAFAAFAIARNWSSPIPCDAMRNLISLMREPIRGLRTRTFCDLSTHRPRLRKRLGSILNLDFRLNNYVLFTDIRYQHHLKGLFPSIRKQVKLKHYSINHWIMKLRRR